MECSGPEDVQGNLLRQNYLGRKWATKNIQRSLAYRVNPKLHGMALTVPPEPPAFLSPPSSPVLGCRGVNTSLICCSLQGERGCEWSLKTEPFLNHHLHSTCGYHILNRFLALHLKYFVIPSYSWFVSSSCEHRGTGVFIYWSLDHRVTRIRK